MIELGLPGAQRSGEELCGLRSPIAEQAACRRAALRAQAAAPVFAGVVAPVVVSAGAFVAAVRASVVTVEVAAVVCVEFPVGCGHRRRAVVVFAAPADVSARRAAAPGLAAVGAGQSAAGVSARVRDWREPRPAFSTKEDGLD